MRNAGLDEAQAGIKIAGRNINHLRYADDTTLMAESKEKLKNLLMKVNEESEKVGLKCNIQKSKIMASGPITSWEIDGETVETVADFILGGFKITAVGDCSHEIKRHLLLGRKVMTNLDSLFGVGNSTLFQYPCLESPMDGGAWWAAVHGVAQSWTQLKLLNSKHSQLYRRDLPHTTGLPQLSFICECFPSHLLFSRNQVNASDLSKSIIPTHAQSNQLSSLS